MTWLHYNHRRTHDTCDNINRFITHQKNKLSLGKKFSIRPLLCTMHLLHYTWSRIRSPRAGFTALLSTGQMQVIPKTWFIKRERTQRWELSLQAYGILKCDWGEQPLCWLRPPCNPKFKSLECILTSPNHKINGLPMNWCCRVLNPQLSWVGVEFLRCHHKRTLFCCYHQASSLSELLQGWVTSLAPPDYADIWKSCAEQKVCKALHVPLVKDVI